MSGTGDSGESIQTYLTSFTKEIEDTGSSQEQNASTSANATGSNVQLADAIYTIDGQKLSAGNIVIADSLGNVEGVQADGAGGYPTFMVNDQQYMLIVEQDENAADGGDGQTLVVTTEGTEAEQVIESADAAATGASTSGSFTTPVTTRSKRNLRNQSTKRIKQEVIEEERENDISVYDFNDHRGHNITVETTGNDEEHGSPHDAGLMTEEDDGEETDEDYKMPVVSKGRGRPKGSESKNKSGVKAASTSIAHHSSGGSLHVCTYCNYTSNKRYLLSRHLKSHSEDRPHKCGICERGFKVRFACTCFYY